MTQAELQHLQQSLRDGEVMVMELRSLLRERIYALGLWCLMSLAVLGLSFYVVLTFSERVLAGSVLHAVLAAVNVATGLFCAVKLVEECSQWIQMWVLQRRMRRWLDEVREALEP